MIEQLYGIAKAFNEEVAKVAGTPEKTNEILESLQSNIIDRFKTTKTNNMPLETQHKQIMSCLTFEQVHELRKRLYDSHSDQIERTCISAWCLQKELMLISGVDMTNYDEYLSSHIMD